MAQQHRDVESRKTVKKVNADVLEEVFRSIRQSLERAAADGVDLHNFECRTRRKIKSKKGKTKRVTYHSGWWLVPNHLITSVYAAEIDDTEQSEELIANG